MIPPDLRMEARKNVIETFDRLSSANRPEIISGGTSNNVSVTCEWFKIYVNDLVYLPRRSITPSSLMRRILGYHGCAQVHNIFLTKCGTQLFKTVEHMWETIEKKREYNVWPVCRLGKARRGRAKPFRIDFRKEVTWVIQKSEVWVSHAVCVSFNSVQDCQNFPHWTNFLLLKAFEYSFSLLLRILNK